jgi:Zn-dependent peptidase ImmA (M78 family)
MTTKWTDMAKEDAIERYTSKNPTPETSAEIVTELAGELGVSANSLRMMLSKANVYVTKAQNRPVDATGRSKAPKAEGTGRVGKEAAQANLIAAIKAAGKEVDEEIISKLTGKAAVYFTGIMK